MIRTVLLIFVFTLLYTPLSFAKIVSGVISMDFDLSHQPQGKDVQLWIPYPISDADQDITGINISGNFSESAVYTDKVYKTPMLYVRWDKDIKKRKLSFSFHASREEVHRRD